jgi:hypothetical protein
MSLPDWATTISGALAGLAAIWAVHRFTTKTMVKDYLSELKPNGGGSIKDKVNEIDRRQQRLENRVDQIYFLIITDKNAK